MISKPLANNKKCCFVCYFGGIFTVLVSLLLIHILLVKFNAKYFASINSYKLYINSFASDSYKIDSLYTSLNDERLKSDFRFSYIVTRRFLNSIHESYLFSESYFLKGVDYESMVDTSVFTFIDCNTLENEKYKVKVVDNKYLDIERYNASKNTRLKIQYELFDGY